MRFLDGDAVTQATRAPAPCLRQRHTGGMGGLAQAQALTQRLTHLPAVAVVTHAQMTQLTVTLTHTRGAPPRTW